MCREQPARSIGLPGCHMASNSVWLSVSRQMKGSLWGTPGGALPPFTPTVTPLTPCAYKIGTAARVKPGTSLCSATTDVPKLLLWRCTTTFCGDAQQAQCAVGMRHVPQLKEKDPLLGTSLESTVSHMTRPLYWVHHWKALCERPPGSICVPMEPL